jgi:hypothetical protein
MIAEAGLVLQRRGRARRFALNFAGFGIHATSRKAVTVVIASEAQQSSSEQAALDCFVASLLAMTVGGGQLVSIATNIRFPVPGRKHLGTVPSYFGVDL